MFNLDTNPDKRNQLLAALPANEYALLRSKLETVDLEINDVLIRADEPVRFVYFPHTALGSMVASPGGQMVEAASIGREGFVGLPALFDSVSTTVTVTQVAGRADRMRSEEFIDLLSDMPVMTTLLRRYALAIFDQVAHTAACNRAHPIVERCAKWLLVISDRTGGDEFRITHQYLATMLGVRRAGVTVAAGILQKAGTIRFTRGKVLILDRAKLKDCACDCYPILAHVSGRVLESVPASNGAHRHLSAIK